MLSATAVWGVQNIFGLFTLIYVSDSRQSLAMPLLEIRYCHSETVFHLFHWTSLIGRSQSLASKGRGKEKQNRKNSYLVLLTAA